MQAGSLEVSLPRTVLETCHLLGSHPTGNTISMTACSEQGEDVQLLITHTGDHVSFLFDAVCGTALQKLEDRWRCVITSVKPTEDTGAALFDLVRDVSPKIEPGSEFVIKVKQEDTPEAGCIEQPCGDIISTAEEEKLFSEVNPATAISDSSDGNEDAGLEDDVSLLVPQRNPPAKVKTRVPKQKPHRLRAANRQKPVAKNKEKRRGRKATKELEFVCSMCSSGYSHCNSLVKHMTESHKDNPQQSEALRDVQESRRLNYKHRGVPLECPVCRETFYGTRGLAHMNNKHADHVDLQQMLTELKFIMNREKNRWRRKSEVGCENNFVCECGKSFRSRTGYRTHAIYRCPRNPDRKELFYCTVCGGHMCSKKSFEKHMLSHQKNKTNYVCDLCGKAYATRCGLLQHSRRDHHIAKVIPIRYKDCPVCGKSFFDARNLTRHMSKHSDEMTEQCDQCGKGFKLRQHLQQHVRTVHLNQYPHHCDKCGHGVDKLKYLDTHICGRVRRKQTKEADCDTAITMATTSAQEEMVVEPGDHKNVEYSEQYPAPVTVVPMEPAAQNEQSVWLYPSVL